MRDRSVRTPSVLDFRSPHRQRSSREEGASGNAHGLPNARLTEAATHTRVNRQIGFTKCCFLCSVRAGGNIQGRRIMSMPFLASQRVGKIRRHSTFVSMHGPVLQKILCSTRLCLRTTNRTNIGRAKLLLSPNRVVMENRLRLALPFETEPRYSRPASQTALAGACRWRRPEAHRSDPGIEDRSGMGPSARCGTAGLHRP